MKKNKIIALVLGALLCFLLAFFTSFMIIEADHDCSGHDCHICATIERGLSVLRDTGFSGIATIGVVALAYLIITLISPKEFHDSSKTLISLKVELII